jgi:anthranilate/para-aminobenzoate synthase component I
MIGTLKVRLIEILDSLESNPRGITIYFVSIRFFSYTYLFDMNIAIRTVIPHGGEASSQS